MKETCIVLVFSRRTLIGGGLAAAGSLLLPRWARADIGPARDEWDIEIAETTMNIAGKKAKVLTMNGSYPGPLIHLREGHEAVLRVKNTLREWSSIHWHGLLVPPGMDGVPGVSFKGIPPGETFEYRFKVRQSGTYWYHSHSGSQEQRGLAGPIVIEPNNPATSDPDGAADREFVIVLTDFTHRNPDRVAAILKKQSAYFNYQKRTVFDALAGRGGMPLGQSMQWARMRMDPTDIADVTASTYEYLLNGHGADERWTGVFAPGERVRLRFINAAAMTYFDLRIPGLPMKVVGTDGMPVRPVEVDELRIGVAETYDVIVEPTEEAYTLFAETMDRSGFAAGTLAVRESGVAPLPVRRVRPLLGMADMGMSMASMKGMSGDGMDGMDGMEGMPGHDMKGMEGMPGHDMKGMEGMPGHDMKGMEGMPGHDMKGMEGMSGHDMEGMSGDEMPTAAVPADLSKSSYAVRSRAKGIEPTDLASLGKPAMHNDDRHGSTNVMVAQQPRIRLAERLNGLEDAPWRVLMYADLEARLQRPDPGPVDREIEIHLTGHMERYIWSFNGKTFEEDPYIDLRYGERVRITYVNDTMMTHPIHLHGMFVEIENGRANRPLKHTVSVAPAERISVLVTADERGDWAYHCHLLYHMDMGMFRVVRVVDAVAGVTP